MFAIKNTRVEKKVQKYTVHNNTAMKNKEGWLYPRGWSVEETDQTCPSGNTGRIYGEHNSTQTFGLTMCTTFPSHSGGSYQTNIVLIYILYIYVYMYKL